MTVPPNIRIGVAGVAGMGSTHIRLVPQLEGAELTAICDVVPKMLEQATGWAPDAKPFTDLGEMCTSGTVDAVMIATPNWLHAEQVPQALEAGVHVYCEKPLGITVGECRRIADVARSTGRKVQVGFQHRFQHGFASAQRVVSTGGIGPVRRAELRGTDWFRPNVYFAVRDWRAKWAKAGGGVLIMQAIHQLDAFLWMAGVPSRVTAKAWRARPDIEVEDDVSAVLEFRSGARGVLTASTLVPAGTNRIELHGDAGTIRAEGTRARLGTWEEPISTMLTERTNPFEGVAVTWEDLEPDGEHAMTFDECVSACHRDFIDAIQSDREPLNNADEATKSVEVANAVYLSAVLGEPVDLPLDAERYDEAFARMRAGELSLPEV
jgi:predicted dehydrogenase